MIAASTLVEQRLSLGTCTTSRFHKAVKTCPLEAKASAEASTGLLRAQAEGHFVPVVERLLAGNRRRDQILGVLRFPYAPQRIHNLQNKPKALQAV